MFIKFATKRTGSFVRQQFTRIEMTADLKINIRTKTTTNKRDRREIVWESFPLTIYLSSAVTC